MKVRKKLLVLTAIRGQCDKEDPQTRRKINLTQLSVEMSISPLPRPKEKGLENCKFNRSILDYEERWQNIHISYVTQWYNLEEKSKKKKYIFPSPSSFSQRVFWQNLKKIILSGPIWERSLMHRAGNVFFCTVNRSAENDHMTSFPKLEWN